jgi:hypothetical protein
MRRSSVSRSFVFELRETDPGHRRGKMSGRALGWRNGGEFGYVSFVVRSDSTIAPRRSA